MELTKEQEREIERAVAILESGVSSLSRQRPCTDSELMPIMKRLSARSLPPSRDRLGTR